MRSLALLLAAILLLCTATIARAQLTPDQEASIRRASRSTIDATMKQVAQRTAVNLPMQLDSVTELQTAYYEKTSRTMVFMGRLLAPIDVERARAGQRDSFCANPANKAFIAKGITYRYHYTRLDGPPISINMTAASCGVALVE